MVVCKKDDVNYCEKCNHQVKMMLGSWKAVVPEACRDARACACCVWTVKSARLLRNSKWLSGEIRFEQRLQPGRFGEGEDGGGEVER